MVAHRFLAPLVGVRIPVVLFKQRVLTGRVVWYKGLALLKGQSEEILNYESTRRHHHLLRAWAASPGFPCARLCS